MADGTLAGNEPLVAAAPEFFVRDLEASLRFYGDGLGFQVLRLEPDFAVAALGGAHLLLALPEAAPGSDAASHLGPWLASGPRGVGVNVRIMVDDVDAMYQRARELGATVVWDIDDRYYGLRDFIIADPDGFLLRFAAPSGAARKKKGTP
ncbi:MAG: VOC family protein [Dehalococcoidia bacterium]|nr:VOC family protein [Dehalococcoidia bacterium]